MFRNYFTVAVRNLFRRKVYSFINILGLAIGVGFCFLTFLYIYHEWSYDSFHESADRIYLIYNTDSVRKNGKTWCGTPFPLASVLLEEVPGVTRVVRMTKTGVLWRYEDESLGASGLFADPAFFEMFSFIPIAGNLKTALEDINSVVITDKLAKQYFVQNNPVGRSISINTSNDFHDYTIAGVVEVPENSSIQFDFIIPFKRNIAEGGMTSWGAWNYYTFVQLTDDAQAAGICRKLVPLVEKHCEREKPDNGTDVWLQALPLTDIHLNASIVYNLAPGGNETYSYILIGVAVSVLLIACVNYVNLSLGLFDTRFKEIGIRKIVGATRLNLMKQFWSESLLLSLIAVFLGIMLMELLQPAFNRLMDQNLRIDYTSTSFVALGLMLTVGFVVGWYPALVLSNFPPVLALKNRLMFGRKKRFGQGLVIFQFSLSVLMVIITLVASDQVAFLRKKNLGFNPEQVIVIDTHGLKMKEKQRMLAIYRDMAPQHGDIFKVSMVNTSFARGPQWARTDTYEGRPVDFRTFTIDFDYFETLEIKMLEGRDFSRDFETEAFNFFDGHKNAIIVNETLVKEFGWDTAVGKELPFLGYSGIVIGVCEDFHFDSLRDGIRAATFTLQRGNGDLRFILTRIRSDDIPTTLALLKDTWKKVIPDHPFVYSFLDEDVERQYRAEEKWVTMISYSTLLAIFIASLGALGLASLTVAQRTKEIGIRKVLGASVFDILYMMSKEFFRLVVIGSILAWPTAYYLLDRWLQDFAYRIHISPGMFVLGGVLTLAIVLLTISSQALKAATSNPVDVLRYE